MRQSGQNLAEYRQASTPLHHQSFSDLPHFHATATQHEHKPASSNDGSLPDIELHGHSIQHTKSHQSLPSIPSTSSLSSSISNYSNPSPLLKYEHKLKKNQSLSSLRSKYSDGQFLITTTFSAPISPKYNNQRFHEQLSDTSQTHKLPPIHKAKQLKQRVASKCDRISTPAPHRRQLSGDSLLISNYLSASNQKYHRQKVRQKANAPKHMKRNASMSALSLDLSSLSIDENSDKLQCVHATTPQSAHVCHLKLNTNNLKSNMLLHFDIAPKSVDSASSYEITPNGAFKQNGFVISSEGLQIENAPKSNVDRQRYEAQSSDFVEVSILGRGSSSVVYKTWDLRNGRFIGLKCISAFEHDKRKQILNELKLLTNNECAEIIEFYGSYFYSGQIMLCLEYFDIGSLQELIEINGQIPVDIISFIMKQIIKAIHYLHTEKRIIYRDIKPGNILIHSTAMIKLSDFGIFHQYDEQSDTMKCKEVIGTTIYMSPQRLSGKEYSFLSDIWSIGLCVAQSIYPKFALFTNYDDCHALLQMYVLQTEKCIFEFYPNEITESLDDRVKDFMTQCLHKKEEDRWNAMQLLQHEFIVQHNEMKDSDFRFYVEHSNMDQMKKEQYKNELVSIQQSLSQLLFKNKISEHEMQTNLQQIQDILSNKAG